MNCLFFNPDSLSHLVWLNRQPGRTKQEFLPVLGDVSGAHPGPTGVGGWCLSGEAARPPSCDWPSEAPPAVV